MCIRDSFNSPADALKNIKIVDLGLDEPDIESLKYIAFIDQYDKIGNGVDFWDLEGEEFDIY